MISHTKKLRRLFSKHLPEFACCIRIKTLNFSRQLMKNQFMNPDKSKNIEFSSRKKISGSPSIGSVAEFFFNIFSSLIASIQSSMVRLHSHSSVYLSAMLKRGENKTGKVRYIVDKYQSNTMRSSDQTTERTGAYKNTNRPIFRFAEETHNSMQNFTVNLFQSFWNSFDCYCMVLSSSH